MAISRHTRRHISLTLFGVFSLVLAACQMLPQTQSPGTVNHVVICWLKKPGDAIDRERLIAVSREFSKIPGVVSVSAGQVLSGNRSTVDSSFDVAVIISFMDEASLRAYEQHPIHVKAVQETLLPLVEKILVYDFVE